MAEQGFAQKYGPWDDATEDLEVGLFVYNAQETSTPGPDRIAT